MAINLLTYLKDQFTPTVIDQLSSTLNETPANVRQAVDAAIPTVLGGLTRRVESTADASDLINMLRKGTYSKEGTPLDVGQVTDTRDETRAAVTSGDPFIQRIFGTNTERVGADIARFSGVAQPSAVVILDLAGSVVMGLLGRQSLDNGLTAVNLSTLLAGQADTFRTAMPAGLSGLGRALGFDKLVSPTGDEQAQKIDTYSGTPINPNIPKSPDIERRQENVRWVRWAMLVVGALIIFLIVQKCRQPQTGTDGIYTDTTATAEPAGAERSIDANRENIEESNASTQDTAAGPFDRTDRDR